jgi:hypothetical protein
MKHEAWNTIQVTDDLNDVRITGKFGKLVGFNEPKDTQTS